MTILESFEKLDYSEALESSSKAQKWLEKNSRRFGQFINGKFVNQKDAKLIASIDPSNGELLANIEVASNSQLNNAVKAARKAQPDWQSLGGHGRAKVLYALARLLQKNSRLIAVLETLDNGKPIRESRDIDIPLAIRHFYHHAGWAQLQEKEFKMRPPSPQYCPYCNRRFPSVNQYRYCDACGQPTLSVGAGLQAQTPGQSYAIPQGPDASVKRGVNSLVILAAGLALIVLIGLVIFYVLNSSNEDAAPDSGPSSTSQPITAPNARIVGSVVGTVETPAKVDYLVIEIENPASGTPLSITREELTILYQDSQNRERISYPSLCSKINY